VWFPPLGFAEMLGDISREGFEGYFWGSWERFALNLPYNFWIGNKLYLNKSFLQKLIN